jgi:hypothetical protein
MKLILLLLSFLILGACSSVSDVNYPDFVNLKPEYTIVRGHIEKGEYYLSPRVNVLKIKYALIWTLLHSNLP